MKINQNICLRVVIGISECSFSWIYVILCCHEYTWKRFFNLVMPRKNTGMFSDLNAASELELEFCLIVSFSAKLQLSRSLRRPLGLLGYRGRPKNCTGSL